MGVPPGGMVPSVRAAVALQSLILALALTWPAAGTFASRAVGSADGDTVKHLWTLWWMRAEALHGVPGLKTTLVDFPVGFDLWPIEPGNGVFAVLLPLGPVALSNLLAILHVWLLGLAAGWVGWLVSERRGGALVAAALAQASSFTAFTLHVGVGELRQVWWIPLGLGCLLKARETTAARWFLVLGVTLVGATLSCFYHGFFLATAVAVVAVGTLRPDRRLLVGYALTATLSTAVVVPVIRTFSTSWAPAEVRSDTFGEWMTRRYELETYRGAALDPLELFRPRDGSPDRQALSYTGGRYLGLSAAALALLGFLAAPRRALPWVALSATGLVLSLGTVLWWNGAIAEVGGGRVVLPLATVNRALAWGAEPLNFPARFLVLPAIGIAVLGALASRWRAALLLTPLAVVEMAWGDLVPWPRHTTKLPQFDMTELRDGAIADLTVFTRGAVGTSEIGQSWIARIDPESRTRGIAAQIRLDRAFSTVPIERVDHWGPEGLYWTAALPLATGLAGGTLSDEERRESAWLLADAGFSGVLVTHACGGPPPASTSVLDQALGPRVAIGCGSLWPVAPAAETAEAETWRAAQADRVARQAPPRMGPQYAPEP